MAKTTKKMFNAAYGIGASIVIIGALFKILHLKYGSAMLIIGMGVEAIIFFLSAFEPVEDELDWTKVYPELAEGEDSNNSLSARSADAETMLSQKLDGMLENAKLDAGLVSNLGDSIRSLRDAASGLSSISEAVSSTNKYKDQVDLAAVKMESLNSLYQMQDERASKQIELDTMLIDHTQKLQSQMELLTNNLSSLNKVYEKMLSAMSSK